MRIDLHAHTTCSDGSDSPEELVAAAVRAGLDVVAITDHDTVEGWARAAGAASAAGIGLVRGVEITATHRGTGVHLLSYLHDAAHPGLPAQFEELRRSRAARAQRMVAALAEDYPITMDDVRAQITDGATVGRPHIAAALVAAGVVPDVPAAFDGGPLADGSPYYVGHYKVAADEAIALVLAAGGVPVLAHGLAVKRGEVLGLDAIEELADAGLAGLEVDHVEHDPAARARLRALAGRRGLLVTGSSDYHGSRKPVALGAELTPARVFSQIEERGALAVS